MLEPQHDWKIVAPWWKWPGLPGAVDTVAGRLTSPAIQKYETSDLVNVFMKNPQHRLRWVLDDVVATYGKRYVPFRTIGGLRKAREVIARDTPLEVDPSDGELKYAVPTRKQTAGGLRKLYLDTHKRFYLVVCQIHCDAPGFPKVARERICEAGFVIRRRTTEPPGSALQEGKKLLQGIAAQRMRIERLEATLPRLRRAARTRVGTAVREARAGSVVRQREFALALLQQEQARLAEWATRFGVAPSLQGWYPSPDHQHLGEWHDVGETPDSLAGEASFPLYPLFPDPDDPNQSAEHATLYFGLLPTGLADHDTGGKARFKEQEYYEVRCWARRHNRPHDRGAKCPCPGELFWSPSTEPYWIAGHYDVIGTSQRPVTIQLPDLKDLAADPKPRQGVSFAKPTGSLAFGVDQDGKATDAGFTKFPQICTLPIPLITIVAMFLLELTLPIVVFLFGLFWMLALRFCFLPSVDIGGGLTAELQGQLGIKLDANLQIDVNLTTDAGEDALQLTEAWEGAANPGGPVNAGTTWVPDLLKAEYPSAPLQAAALQESCSTVAIVNLHLATRAGAPDVLQGLEFETEYAYP
jgi:hypothetical protein